ncbi:TPA: S-4TM family putative pore-forming effector [Salmonella enterica]
MSQIFLRQNDNKNIELLMAMRRIYSQIKFVNWVVFLLSVIISVVIVVFTALAKRMGFFPDLAIAPYLGYYGIVVLFITIIFSSMISSMKKCAATIQEMFDCDVLQIPWSELKVGKKVCREVIFKSSQYYKTKNKRDEFHNWYLNKDYAANEYLMALLCHAKNFGWDKTQRDIMSKIYFITMLISFLILVAYGLWSKSSLEDFLFYIVFMLPFFRHVIMLYIENNKSINRIVRVKDFIEKKIQSIKVSGLINNEIISHDLRSIQDEVFAHRSTSNPVPNCLHRFMRKNNEAIYDDYFEDNLKLLPR